MSVEGWNRAVEIYLYFHCSSS